MGISRALRPTQVVSEIRATPRTDFGRFREGQVGVRGYFAHTTYSVFFMFLQVMFWGHFAHTIYTDPLT